MRTILLAVCLGAVSMTCAAQGREKTTEAADGKVIREKLISCVEASDADCVTQLLKAGAGPDAADARGVAILSLAAEGRSVSIVRLLLDAGADVNKAGAGDGTPLCRAALFGRKEIAELLMERGAEVNVVCDSDHGDTPLMTALRGAMLGGMPGEMKDGISGADGDRGGGEDGDAGAAGEVRRGAKLREALNTPADDFLAVARALLARGADVNAVAKCDAGETALMYAASAANLEIVKALLARGANVRKGASVLAMLTDMERESEKAKGRALPAISREQAATLAWVEKTKEARAEIAYLLRAAGAEDAGPGGARENTGSDAAASEEAARETFSDAIEKDDLKDLARLVDAYTGHPLGARVLPEALRLAVIYSRDEMVKLLLARGVPPNPPSDSPGGFTPLMHAVHSGNLEYVRMLLEAGADVSREDDKGVTALDAAERWAGSREEYRVIVELLKARGANGKKRE
jgi:ankyrin repeat protein